MVRLCDATRLCLCDKSSFQVHRSPKTPEHAGISVLMVLVITVLRLSSKEGFPKPGFGSAGCLLGCMINV